MTVRLKYNSCYSTLNGAINDSTTTIELNTELREAVTGIAIPTLSAEQILVMGIGSEIVYVTGYTTGTTTLTVLRGQEGTVAAAHADGATIRNTATKIDYDRVDDNLWLPTTETLIGSDEFNDGAIDPAWFQVDKSGTAASMFYKEANSVISLKHEGLDAAQEWHALLRPIDGSLEAPVTIEASVRYAGPYTTNYLMSGIGFSNSGTWGTGNIVTNHGYAHTGNASGLFLTHYSGTWSSVSTMGTAYGNSQVPGGRYYFKMEYAAANTWNAWWSGDGVTWIQTLTNHNYVMSPSHFGLFHSHYGGNIKTITTWEYFRVYQ